MNVFYLKGTKQKMRSLLVQVLLFLAYFHVISSNIRLKRQFGMNNDDGVNPFSNFANFDQQTSFEKQKSNLMQELELKLQELRQNNKQELANAVLELKHQLTGLGKTLLLSQTQQGLLLSQAAMRKDNHQVAVATTTERSEEVIHRSMFTKLEELYKNFTKLTSKYRNGISEEDQELAIDDDDDYDITETKQVKGAKKKSKLKNFLDLNNIYDYLNVNAQQAKEMKSKNKKKNNKLPQQFFWLKKSGRNSEKPVIERPQMYDNQRQSAVERSFETANKGGGSEDQFYNKYIYYIAAAGLAIFAFCCYTVTAVDEVDLQTQKKLMKKREKKRRERKRKSRKRRHSRKSKQKIREGSISVSPIDEQQQLSAIFSNFKSGNASASEPKQATGKVSSAVQTGFTLHQVDKADPVIVFEADKVHQFCGADSGMANRLQSMMGDSKLITQLIESRKCLTEKHQPLPAASKTPVSFEGKSICTDGSGAKTAAQTPNVTTVSPKSVISMEKSHTCKEKNSQQELLYQKIVTSKSPKCKSK